jgi:hypothetical protein
MHYFGVFLDLSNAFISLCSHFGHNLFKILQCQENLLLLTHKIIIYLYYNMKKLALICLIALCGLGLTANAQQKKYQVYGAAFYNLENLFDTINNNGKYDKEFSPDGPRQWNAEKYWSKMANMAKAISHFTTPATPKGPAVIGVSEIENITVLQDLVKHPLLKEWKLQIVHHDSPDRRGVDVALLYNPRFFRVLNVTNARVKVEGYDSFRTRDQMCVTGLMGGDKVSVIVNHWPSRSGGEETSRHLRAAAAHRVKLTVDSLLNDDPNQGIIIMGDLNDDPFNESVAKVLGAKKDKKKVGKGELYNPGWSLLDKGIGTLAYQGNWNFFDQIIISDYFLTDKNSGKLSYMKTNVLNFDFLINAKGQYKGYPHRTFSGGAFLNGYSDHFPVETFFVKKVN